MDIDGEAIGKACGSTSKCDVYDNLCGAQLNLVLEQLKSTKENNKNLFIACTQEQHTFEQLAEENDFDAPKTFNIREYAGWSKENNNLTPKISSLINSSMKNTKQTPSLTLESSGRCFVYVDASNGDDSLEIAADFCQKLSSHLGVTLMISNDKGDFFTEIKNFKITKGSIKKAQGYFSKFKIEISDFSEILKSSKSRSRIWRIF
jgi:hypothetical protein